MTETTPHAHGHNHIDHAHASSEGTATVDPTPSDYRDSHQCAAYLAEHTLAALGSRVGDVLRVSTARGRTALVRVLGVHPNHEHGAIRFDRFTRQTLKAYPHEAVRLERVDLMTAEQVTLIPAVDISMLHVPNLVPGVKAILADAETPVREGMLLYVRLPDAGAGITYQVHSVTGGGEGLITPHTSIYMEFEHDHDHGTAGHQHESGSDVHAEAVVDTTFEDVGGLNEQIRAVREFVELPLVFPQVYRQLGIMAPKGVIFFGAPGTGKTLLARSVANEVNAEFFSINGPEVVGTFSGQTEENLRRIFGEAAFKAPSIIFIDELDAIAPARRTATTLSDSRAVTQLLSLMDGLKRAEGVIVIGTTNRIDAIDPALRRAGRFDREIYFPSPSAEAREEILRVQTREMPLDDDALATLPRVAQQAYGYVGADLMELAREAGLAALRRASGEFIERPSVATAARSIDLVVTADDLTGALKRMRPASLRESILSYPTSTFDDVGGLDDVKERLRQLVESPLRHPELYARVGLRTSLGVLLYGPPGTGKTLLAQAIAHESGANFIAVRGPELFSQWFGESEEAVRDLFDLARRVAPCIVFFDQLDAVAPRRSDLENEGTRAPQRIVNQLLTELDQLDEAGHVVIIGATNRFEMIDPAILRPGRFGVHLPVPPPDHAGRAEILGIHLRGAVLEPDLDRDALVGTVVSMTDTFSGADLAFLCQAAKLSALERGGYASDVRLSLVDFEAAIDQSRSPSI